MGGCRCSYKNCANTTKTRENLHFFHYPVKQKDRCRQWIENANKPQFYDLDEDQLRNKVICETHFKDCFFPNSQKKRLLQGAVPTLDGDCEEEPACSGKIQDVQVLPANADGTIFVLETNNMQNDFNSGKIESYIYTNSGLVLPISKCSEVNGNIQHIFSENEIDDLDDLDPHLTMKIEQQDTVSLHSSCENLTQFEGVNYVFQPDSIAVCEDFEMASIEEHKPVPQTIVKAVDREFKPIAETIVRDTKQLELISQDTESVSITDDVIYKVVGNKYVKKIKQHSKDIAIIKRMLKSSQSRKPTNFAVLNSLRRQIPSSLLSMVNLQLSYRCDLTPDDLDFFSAIYATSPEVYSMLSKKYNWKLPNPDALTSVSKSNGHLSSGDT